MLHADIEEMQHATEIVDVNDLRDDGMEVMAAEMQKLGERTSRWKQNDVWWLTENQSRLRAGQITCRFGRKDEFQQPTRVGQTPRRKGQDQVFQRWRGWTLGWRFFMPKRARE